MLDIPSPPAPVDFGASAAYASAAGAIVLGVVMLVWGRKVHRFIVALAVSPAGLLLVGPVMRALRFEQEKVVAGALMFCAAVAGFILARIAWAAALGAFGAAAAAVAITLHYAPHLPAESAPAFNAAPAETAMGWLRALGEYALPRMQAVFQQQAAAIVVPLGAVAGALALVGLLWPRATAILMTSLLGSAAMAGGASLAAAIAAPKLWSGKWTDAYVPLCAAGGLLLLGLVVQGWAAVVSARAAKAQEQEKPAKDKAEETPKTK